MVLSVAIRVSIESQSEPLLELFTDFMETSSFTQVLHDDGTCLKANHSRRRCGLAGQSTCLVNRGSWVQVPAVPCNSWYHYIKVC